MLQEIVNVLFNTRVGPGYFRIGLACNPAYARAVPGQFVMLRKTDQIAPLLRRPFSIHRRIQSNGKVTGIEILYKVVGNSPANLPPAARGRRWISWAPWGVVSPSRMTAARSLSSPGASASPPWCFWRPPWGTGLRTDRDAGYLSAAVPPTICCAVTRLRIWGWRSASTRMTAARGTNAW